MCRTKKVSVPLNAISRVIGRGGSNINAIRGATGAHIEVEKQSKGQGERIITIKGSAEATKHAHSLIGALIKDPDVDILQMLPKTNKVVVTSSLWDKTNAAVSYLIHCRLHCSILYFFFYTVGSKEEHQDTKFKPRDCDSNYEDSQYFDCVDFSHTPSYSFQALHNVCACRDPRHRPTTSRRRRETSSCAVGSQY